MLARSVPGLGAQTPLSLDEAVREARAHNAQLPAAAFDTAIAEAGIREAKGRLWPELGIGGHVHGGTPSHYASDDARLQVLLRVPLYSGGGLQADVRRATAQHDLSLARYRMAAKDLDFEVRLRFAQTLAFEQELTLRRQGLARLDRYVELVATRQRSGEPVTGDLLKARVRRDRQEADLEDARRQVAGSLLELKELLGREPDDSLIPAPLPPPAPPSAAGDQPWSAIPDVLAAQASERSAEASIEVIRAERRPHLDLTLNAGAEPVLGSSFDAPLNTGRGNGAELTLSLVWPLWDHGVYGGRIAQAEIASRQAEAESSVTRRGARLAWNRASADLEHLYREVQVRERTVPASEDAYLQAESLYRGGGATSLEVLDAFDEWIQAGLDATYAILDYRIVEARAQRWGTA